MTKLLVLEKRIIESLEPIGRARVYIPMVAYGRYPRADFIRYIERASAVRPEGVVVWEDILMMLESAKHIRYEDDYVVVDRGFSTTVVTDLYSKIPIYRPILREVPTMVGILRWAAYRQIDKDRYKRVKELLIYFTPDNTKIVDDEYLKDKFFRALIECTPVMQRWGLSVREITGQDTGWGYPYSSERYGGMPPKDTARKAVFEVSTVTAEVPDGFWEYSDYDMEEFLEGIDLIDKGLMDAEDLKLRARGGRSMDFGTIDANECLRDIRTSTNTPPMEVIKIGKRMG